MSFIPLNEGQHLHLVNSDQLYRAWAEARETLSQYRYGMRWVTSKGKRYLVRLMDADGKGRSLGPENEETQAILEKFTKGKDRATTRYQGLSEKLESQARLNHALRLGRIPAHSAKLLSALGSSKLNTEFLVVGTHALFAYEAMAGVHIEPELLATTDFDLCFDPRRPLKLVIDKMHQSQIDGLIGLLRKVDKSYEPMQAQSVFRAINQDGFMVDIIIPERSMRDNTVVTFSSDDLVASEVPNLHWLVNAPKCKEVVIARNGMPLFMQVPDPRAFALHKAWLSQNPDRNPSKRIRDNAQAKTVVSLIGRYLPQYPFEQSQLKYLSKDMIQLATEVMPPSEDEYDFLADLRLLDKRESPRS